MTRRLLAVDWDYFFPTFENDPQQWQLWDWGHQENGIGKGPWLWGLRGAGFLANGMELPGLSGQQEHFWRRFRFARGARLLLSDSNSQAARPEVWEEGGLPQQVLLYDAHHDSGYTAGREEGLAGLQERLRFTCENWMLWYHLNGARLMVRYPKWKARALEIEPVPWVPVDRRIDDEREVLATFHDVVLCRSGAWVPPWLDEAFLQFVESCPLPRVWLDKDRCEARPWSLEQTQQHADMLKGMQPS